MRVIDAVRRSGVAVEVDATVQQAAAVMEQSGVGCLVVLDGEQLAGIVTDRDLVRRAMARALAPDARVDGVMSSPVVTVEADADVAEAFTRFGESTVRRLAVVRDGRFVGVLALDDLLGGLAGALTALAHPVTAELASAHRESPLPATS